MLIIEVKQVKNCVFLKENLMFSCSMRKYSVLETWLSCYFAQLVAYWVLLSVEQSLNYLLLVWASSNVIRHCTNKLTQRLWKNKILNNTITKTKVFAIIRSIIFDESLEGHIFCFWKAFPQFILIFTFIESHFKNNNWRYYVFIRLHNLNSLFYYVLLQNTFMLM